MCGQIYYFLTYTVLKKTQKYATTKENYSSSSKLIKDRPDIAVVVRVHILLILRHNQFEAFCRTNTNRIPAQHTNQLVYPYICLSMASHNKSFRNPSKQIDSIASLHHRNIILI